MPRLPYRGDKYQASRDLVAAYWKKQGWKYAARLGRFAAFGPLALAAAGAANFVTRIPSLSTRPDMGRSMQPSRKRARSDGKTSVKYDKGGYAQLTYDRAKCGKKLTRTDRVSKLVNSHTFDVIERFQNITNLSSGSGAYSLNWDDSGANQNSLPMYLFDLTCLPNKIGDNVTTSYPQPFTRLYRNKLNATLTAGAYYTNIVAGRNADDAGDSYLWQAEREPSLFTNRAHERALIEWCNLRFVLYGARKNPSWIKLQIVQFVEEDQVPGGYSTDPAIVSTEAGRILNVTDPNYNRWQTTWQGAVDQLTGSTIGIRDLKEQKLKLRVKFSKMYKFNPTMTTESDVSGHQVSVNFNYAMNKVCSYVEDPRAHTEVSPVEEVNPNEFPVYDQHVYSSHTAPKGREFLMITGYTGKPVSAYGTGIDADFAPSFDMAIRRKRTHMRS